MTSYPKITSAKQLVEAYRVLGSLKEVSRRHKTGWTPVHKFYVQAVAEGLMDKLPRGSKSKDHVTKVIKGKVVVKKRIAEGRRKVLKAEPLDVKTKGVTRFLFTCAQNNTKVHEGFFNNLLAFADYYKAELHVSRFSYIKQGLGARGDKKQWFAACEAEGPMAKGDVDDFWFDEKLAPYYSDDQRAVAPGLVWRGDANISPTMVNPLSGKSGMTGRKSGIFPHVTIAMESVPSMEQGAVKLLYTTGTVTMRNYIMRDAGFKADFHHTYGALLVEVYEGNWWCRQINADSEGTFQDLDIVVKNGEVTKLDHTEVEHLVESCVWGDLHDANADENVCQVVWADGGVLDFLRPKTQFYHDALDMYARSHHEIDNPHQLLLRHVKRQDNVKKENMGLAARLEWSHRDWCQSVVVNSNHDRALLKWLANKSAMLDPVNFDFWSELNHRVNQRIVAEKDFPVVLREAYLTVTGRAKEPKWLRFLAQDESFIVCPDRNGGIECGAHGDDGPNGSRGTSNSFTRIGRRVTRGHEHTASIKQNVHTVGTFRKLRVDKADYTHGPSSWSHSFNIIYKSAKRQIITIWAGRAWAPR